MPLCGHPKNFSHSMPALSTTPPSIPQKLEGVKRRLLFVGNASYSNRGCEAIIRGTMAILEQVMQKSGDWSVTNGYYGNVDSLGKQSANEADDRITHKRLVSYPKRWSLPWFAEKANEWCGTKFAARHQILLEDARSASFALEIGGDNYTLDYGFPQRLIDLDRWLASKGVPVIIWGASIGPFTEDAAAEKKMMAHLATLPAIFVRESATFDYLTRDHGLKNVHQFADPAFMLEPVEPPLSFVRSKVMEAPIGINVSPLFRAYRGEKRQMPWRIRREDLREWVKETAGLVGATRRKTGRAVLLIPHVASDLPGIDDFSFLADVHSECSKLGISGVELVSDDLNAAELKWVISRCSLLIAARTHATIAGFSTAVPTISLGYSRKAVGINRDVFGTEEFCLSAKDFSETSWLIAVDRALSQETSIREHLAKRSKELKASALAAGPKIFDVLSIQGGSAQL
jgi:colanic acid/amylovoran biosynthesis protein